MKPRSRTSSRRKVFALVTTLLLAVTLAAVPNRKAEALISGGEGNKPISDPGWPKGAAELFNHPGRIAYWEGPPFGGGEWHAECRGDTKEFNTLLAAFAKLDIKTKRMVVHDGPGSSFWLNASRSKDKVVPKIDWVFMVWQPNNWNMLRKIPGEIGAEFSKNAEDGPPSQIDVYTGGGIVWDDVVVPQGIKVDDQRMETHGFKPADGHVLEGKVIDLATKKPLAARVRLQRVEPQKTGGYLNPTAVGTVADAQGHWVLTNAPTGWHRVVVEADGYVSRIAGYGQFDEVGRWHSYDTGLLPPAPVSGRVTDAEGKPLADVDVRFDTVVPESGGRYESPDDYKTKTDADGNFRAVQLPVGKTAVWLHKDGYCRPGLGLAISTPKSGVALTMSPSTKLIVTIDFKGAPRPAGYLIEINPEGKGGVGTWGGSANIDEKNQHTFENVPPGKYVLAGHPNPSGPKERTDPITVDLKGGETKEITIVAKPIEVPKPSAKEPVKPPKATDDRF